MDPTIEVLTIRSAAWAALFEGLTEGLLYGFAGVAVALVVMALLLSWLGRRGEAGASLEALSDAAWRAAAAPAARSRPAVGGLLPLVASPHRVHAPRRRRRSARTGRER